MDLEIRSEENLTIVALRGEVDLHVSPQARRAILQCLDGAHDVLVDLSAVDYIDSSGIASLVEGYQTARRQQVRFGLVSVSASAMNVLKLARLDGIFPIYNSIAEHRATPAPS